MFGKRPQRTISESSAATAAPRLTASGNTASNRVQLAHALLSDGQYDAALAELEVALRDNPELAEGQLVKGLALARKGHYRAAIGPLRMAIEFGEQPRLASFSLAALYMRLEEFLRTLALGEELSRRDACDPQAHALRGEALSRLGRTEEAIAAYSQAASLDPKLAAVRLRLGELMAEQNAWELACRELAAAVELAPTDVRGLEALAKALRHVGRSDEAVEICKRALHCAAPKAELFLIMAECCLDERKLFDALVALRIAMTLDPQSVVGHRLLSRVFSEQGRHEQSRQHAAAAERLSMAQSSTAVAAGDTSLKATTPADPALR